VQRLAVEEFHRDEWLSGMFINFIDSADGVAPQLRFVSLSLSPAQRPPPEIFARSLLFPVMTNAAIDIVE